MDCELTGRKVKVTKQLRAMAEDGLARIEKLIGKSASAHVILTSGKHSQTAEITVNSRHRPVIGVAEASNLETALRTALDKAEKQALRRKKSIIEKKRQSRPISSVLSAAPATNQSHRSRFEIDRPASANGSSPGPHIVSAQESLAQRPMTLEEAVKEAESRNQPVFVFRDSAGDVKVLHCAGDGLVRLVEVF
jgi:putative sigma-54 modulation protein